MNMDRSTAFCGEELEPQMPQMSQMNAWQQRVLSSNWNSICVHLCLSVVEKSPPQADPPVVE